MVEHADHVVVLDAGRVADQGTPTDLIARGGWFAAFAAFAAGAHVSEGKAISAATCVSESMENQVDSDDDDDVGELEDDE